MARTDRSRVIVGTGNLTSSYSVIDLKENTSLEPKSKAIPDFCQIRKLEVEITTIASSPTTVTWYLAKDSAGNFGITPATASTIVLGLGDATKGSFNALIDCERALTANDVVGHIYLVAKTDAGTLTISKAILSWTR